MEKPFFLSSSTKHSGARDGSTDNGSSGGFWDPVTVRYVSEGIKCTILQTPKIDANMYCFMCVHAKSLQSCLTLCDSVDCSPPGSSIHEILQARTLEWVATSSSGRSS